jgi:hypothetical protein
MERMIVQAGCSGFIRIDQVLRMERNAVAGRVSLQDTPPSLALESLAQLAALHTRWRCDFSEHGFLLGITTCTLPRENVTGTAHICAEVTGASKKATRYLSRLDIAGQTRVKAELTIGLKPYDEIFRRDLLEPGYRNLLQHLVGRRHA